MCLVGVRYYTDRCCYSTCYRISRMNVGCWMAFESQLKKALEAGIRVTLDRSKPDH